MNSNLGFAIVAKNTHHSESEWVKSLVSRQSATDIALLLVEAINTIQELESYDDKMKGLDDLTRNEGDSR